MSEAIHNPILSQVSQKLLLRRGRELLVLCDTASSFLDFPGGRLNASVKDNLTTAGLLVEFEREVAEELGEDVRYSVNTVPVGTGIHLDTEGVPTFSVFYEGIYVSGEIVLSEEHGSMRWVSVDDYDPTGEKWKKSYEEVVREYVSRNR